MTSILRLPPMKNLDRGHFRQGGCWDMCGRLCGACWDMFGGKVSGLNNRIFKFTGNICLKKNVTIENETTGNSDDRSETNGKSRWKHYRKTIHRNGKTRNKKEIKHDRTFFDKRDIANEKQ